MEHEYSQSRLAHLGVIWLVAMISVFVTFCALVVMAGAQETQAPGTREAGIVFELGAIGTVAPSYEGSNRFVAYPLPVVRFHSLRLKNGFELGGGSDEGFSIYPSLLYRAERSATKDLALTGLSDVGEALELGAGIAYRMKNLRAFVDLRYGAVGHNGIVGETGIDLIVKPKPRLTLSLGPRLSFASKDYMDTYFAVSAADAATSGLAQNTVAGGFKTAGLKANMRYDLTDTWAIESVAGWDRLIGDAASSPITSLGDRNQFTFGVGFTRKFKIGF